MRCFINGIDPIQNDFANDLVSPVAKTYEAKLLNQINRDKTDESIFNFFWQILTKKTLVIILYSLPRSSLYIYILKWIKFN